MEALAKNTSKRTKRTALFTAGCSGAGKTEYASYKLTQDEDLRDILKNSGVVNDKRVF